MKKSILLVAVALVALVGCSGSESSKKAPERQFYTSYYDYDLDEFIELHPLYGDIEELSIVMFEASEKFGELTKEECFGRVVYNFNQRGDVLTVKVYDESGLVAKQSVEYDKDGNPTKGTTYRDGDIDEMVKNEYDSKGNVVRSMGYDEDGDLDWYIEYECDKRGNIVKLTEYTEDGELSSMTRQKFDSKDRITETSRYDSLGTLSSQNINVYDNKGNVTRSVYRYYSEWSEEYEQFTTTSEFDSKGRLVGWLSESDNSKNKARLTLDSEGRCVESLISAYVDEYEEWRKEEKFTYEYDSEGNVVRTIEYEVDENSAEPIAVVEYKIVYR